MPEVAGSNPSRWNKSKLRDPGYNETSTTEGHKEILNLRLNIKTADHSRLVLAPGVHGGHSLLGSTISTIADVRVGPSIFLDQYTFQF